MVWLAESSEFSASKDKDPLMCTLTHKFSVGLLQGGEVRGSKQEGILRI